MGLVKRDFISQENKERIKKEVINANFSVLKDLNTQLNHIALQKEKEIEIDTQMSIINEKILLAVHKIIECAK